MLFERVVKILVGCLLLAGFGWLAAEAPVERLVFASCYKQNKEAPALKTIADWKPEVFVWMGDNIYGDSSDVSVLRAKYEKVSNNPDYLKIRKNARVLGTWDDHDYGANDAGKEFGPKAESQQAFLDFLQVPAASPRRKRSGVYSFQDLGPKGKQVRLIFLDTRYHRDKIGSNGTVLGKGQWKWLRETLQGSEAQINLIISSIQVLPSEHRFQKWSDFETERERFLTLLEDEKSPPVLLLSGTAMREKFRLMRPVAAIHSTKSPPAGSIVG